jgi:catechol 2,3-dioxygenase-like lactoylglutathione lyase family enzyme
MIDHTGIGVADVRRSANFYDAALGALGLRRVMQMPDNVGTDGIAGVDRASAKLCCTGPMTAGRFEANVQGPLGGGATKFFENDCAHREGASSSSAWPRAK